MAAGEVKNMHIAVYALSLLGGAHQKIHTEHIAQKCFDLAPDRFKWENFNYPDKELVRKALFHASEAKNGALLTGRAGMEQQGKSRDGWQLTAAGAAWMRENELLVQAALGSNRAAVRKVEADRFLKRLRGEAAFRHFVMHRSLAGVSPYMFTDLLNCSPDAPLDTIRAKFERLMSMAQLVNDTDVLQFLDACRAAFGRLLPAVEPQARMR